MPSTQPPSQNYFIYSMKPMLSYSPFLLTLHCKEDEKNAVLLQDSNTNPQPKSLPTPIIAESHSSHPNNFPSVVPATVVWCGKRIPTVTVVRILRNPFPGILLQLANCLGFPC